MVSRCCFMAQLQQTSCTRVLLRSRIVQLLNITRTHIQSVCVHFHCKQRFTHQRGEDSSLSLPGFVDSASANVCLVFLRLPTPPLLLHLVTLPQRVPIRSLHRRFGARHTHHILVPNREFLRIRGTPLHCEGTAQSDQSGSRALLLIETAFHTISCSHNSLLCTSTSCLHFQPDKESCSACL